MRRSTPVDTPRSDHAVQGAPCSAVHLATTVPTVRAVPALQAVPTAQAVPSPKVVASPKALSSVAPPRRRLQLVSSASADAGLEVIHGFGGPASCRCRECTMARHPAAMPAAPRLAIVR
jgi:hypothetical protein